jgi:phosphatidylglycerophosphate synthase
MRRIALVLAGLGISSEAAGITGMVLGILAGVSFVGTGQPFEPMLFWALGLLFCLLRIACIRIDGFLYHESHRVSAEEIPFRELPDRVSDAVTLIGLGFAANSSPWLGLLAALGAIFSASVRSYGVSRGAERKNASTGPMTRIHRLILLSATSALIILGVPNEKLTTPVPQIALWIIFFGCLATIAIRWLNIRERTHAEDRGIPPDRR